MRSRYIAAVQDKPWWLAGGIPASACIAAYQAKGASSYEASKVNLANPGTYDCIAGGAVEPTLTADGWFFADDTTHRLNTQLVCGGYWSLIVKFKRENENSTTYIFGSYSGVNYHMIYHLNAVNKLAFLNGGSTRVNGVLVLDGVACLTNEQTYINNTKYGTPTAGSLPGGTYGIGIGGRRNDEAIPNDVWVAAAAIYYNTLIDNQVAALTAAMNAL